MKFGDCQIRFLVRAFRRAFLHAGHDGDDLNSSQ
jgi:hypothetical protein